MDAIAVRARPKRYRTRDGSVVALEGISVGIGVALVGSGCGTTTTSLIEILGE